MLTDLPSDVLERILSFIQYTSTPAQFARLALVSPSVRTLVNRLVVRNPVFSTTGGATAFLAKAKNVTLVASDVRALVLRRKESAPSRIRFKADESCSEEDLLRLCSVCTGINELHLEETAFTTLKRRQVGFASNLSSLRILSIAGSGAGFNLHTVALILQDLPRLEDVALKRIQAFPAALKALPPPTCRLRRFALHESPSVSPKQLEWLLAAAIEVDSLRNLAFDIADIPPSRLGGLRWAATPVRSLRLTSSELHAVEKLAAHFPSLSTYTFATSGHPDVLTLLSSCGKSASFQQLVDRSVGDNGLQLLELASALLYLRRRGRLASLRRVVLPSHRRLDRAFRVLAEVCMRLGIVCDAMVVQPASID
ncbi:hypothetical protein JCM10295v2_004804 [Rhodotorula toruloides]